MHATGGPKPAVTPVPGEASDDQAVFERFVEEAGPRLGRALAALYGFEDGRDATAEALAYAWETGHGCSTSRTFRATCSGSGRPAAAAGASQSLSYSTLANAAITASSPACLGHLLP